MSKSYFLSSDLTAASVYKHTGFTSTVEWTLSSANYAGLAYNFTNLLTAMYRPAGNKIFRFVVDSNGDPNGSVIASFSSPAGNIGGLYYDGTNLWSCDYFASKIYKHSGLTATVSSSFSTPGGFAHYPFDIDKAGNDLIAQETDGRVWRYSGFTSTVSNSFSCVRTDMAGLSFDGTNILSSNYTTNKIYKHSGFSNTISDSFSSPAGEPGSLAWFNTTDVSCSVYDSISITEARVIAVTPLLTSVFDSIASTENTTARLPILIVSKFEGIVIQDIVLSNAINYITNNETIAITESVTVIPAPLLVTNDSISLESYVAFLLSPLLSTYELITVIEDIYVRRNVLDLEDYIAVNETVIIDIHQYGLKVIDSTDIERYSLVTTNTSSLVSGGRVSMPTTVEAEGGVNVYGVDITIPGESIVPLANIGVVALPVTFVFKIANIDLTLGDFSNNIGYMSPTQTYYEHNKTTGAMTTWSAGSLVNGDPANFDHIAGMFPVAFWEIKGGTYFTKIRLFAAMCYLCYDSSAGTYKKVYTIGTSGVSEIDYAIFIKNYNPYGPYIRIYNENITITESVGLVIS